MRSHCRCFLIIFTLGASFTAQANPTGGVIVSGNNINLGDLVFPDVIYANWTKSSKTSERWGFTVWKYPRDPDWPVWRRGYFVTFQLGRSPLNSNPMEGQFSDHDVWKCFLIASGLIMLILGSRRLAAYRWSRPKTRTYRV